MVTFFLFVEAREEDGFSVNILPCSLISGVSPSFLSLIVR